MTLSEISDKMAHSTGHPDRLGRLKESSYGDADYAREENAAYLKGWLEELNREPTYLFDILTDVNRAVRMISETLEGAEPMIEDAASAEAA